MNAIVVSISIQGVVIASGTFLLYELIKLARLVYKDFIKEEEESGGKSTDISTNDPGQRADSN